MVRIEAAKPHWIPATVPLREIQYRGCAAWISQLKCCIADLQTRASARTWMWLSGHQASYSGRRYYHLG